MANPKPNKLGFITNLSFANSYSNVVEFSLSGIATPENEKALFHKLKSWSRDGQMPIYESEWMCLYCASPNSAEYAHCTQCGAPRNFLLG